MNVKSDQDREVLTQPCTNCYLCGETGKLIYKDLKDYLFGVPGYWNIRKCSNAECGLLWDDPMPVAEDIGKLYETYYTHSANTHDLGGQAQGFRGQLKNSILSIAYGYRNRKVSIPWLVAGFVLSKIRFMKDRIGRSIVWQDASRAGHLLDIGCGNGDYLLLMRNLGWEVRGIEPDPNAARVGREKYGLDITAGLINEVDLPENYFDVVTLNHVIEHLHDPLETLQAVRRLLKKGGRIVLVTPNTGSLGHKLFQKDWRGLETPRHLFIYSVKNIKSLLSKAGYKVELVRTYDGSASSIFARSMAIRNRQKFIGENPNDAHGKHYKIKSKIFSAVESILCGWPFHKKIGEELIAMAVKK